MKTWSFDKSGVSTPTYVAYRLLTNDDAEDFLASVRESISLHSNWVSLPQTKPEFFGYLDSQGSSGKYILAVTCAQTDAIAGIVTVHISASIATVGFYAFLAHSQRGKMTAGLRLILNDLLGRKVSEINAYCQSQNLRSIKILQRLGFLAVNEYLSIRINKENKIHQKWSFSSGL
jgi:RimJ/RimL family protein N-acetyltransferase